MVLVGQIISNRGIFYLTEYFTFSGDTAWYRARLIEVAIMKLPEYWAFGYGMIDPGWGHLIDNRDHTDICNQYVLQAAYHGLGGLGIFVSLFWASLAGLRRTVGSAKTIFLKEAVWFIGISLVALAVVFFSVGVFGKFNALLYVLFGLSGSFYTPKAIKSYKLSTLHSATKARSSLAF